MWLGRGGGGGAEGGGSGGEKGEGGVSGGGEGLRLGWGVGGWGFGAVARSERRGGSDPDERRWSRDRKGRDVYESRLYHRENVPFEGADY